MIAKLNIVSTLAALVFFFLPWIDIQCSNRSVMTQSGAQIIYGGGSVPKELKAMEDEAKRTGTARKEESVGISILVGIAWLAVVGAAVTSFLAFRGTSPFPGNTAGVLCAVALTAISIQMAVGFPVVGKMTEDLSKESRGRAGGALFPGIEVAAAIIQVRQLPALYLELIALGIPTLILGNSLLDKMKKS